VGKEGGMRTGLYLITAQCRLTGPWREYVRAESPAAAVAWYCVEHGMRPEDCRADEVLELKAERLKAERRAA
jgi:hypothetical protein